jgi:Arc/MetJ-type ribon-helix-helix transcriptional regulator
MLGMKLSVSLPDSDVDFLDAYAAARSLTSRSAVLQEAIRNLRLNELRGSYEQAWDDWTERGDADDWEPTASDGL